MIEIQILGIIKSIFMTGAGIVFLLFGIYFVYSSIMILWQAIVIEVKESNMNRVAGVILGILVFGVSCMSVIVALMAWGIIRFV